MEKQIIKTINPFDNYGFDSDTEFIPNGMPVVRVSPEDNMITISNGTISSTIKLDIENGILSLIGVDDKVISSVTLPLASGIKDAYFDDETNEVVLIIELSDGTEKEVKFSINFSEYATKEDIKTINDNLVTSIYAINKNMADGFNTINGGINNEIRPAIEENKKAIEGKISYDIFTKDGKDYNTIMLDNYANLLGKSTDGTAYNLAMVSKWDVADFGSTQLPFNMNGSKERPTYNDTKEVALLEDVESETKRVDAMVNVINTNIQTVNNNLVDSINTINGGINNEIRPELEKAVKYTTFDTNRKTIQLDNHNTISGLMTNGTGANIAMVSKWDVADFGSTQLPINLNGSEERPTYNDTKEIALLEDIKVSSVTLEQDPSNNLHYELLVNDVKAGDINIPKDQFLKEASYDADNKELVFVFVTETGETTTKIDVSNLVDTYTAGNGLELANNTFSAKITDGDKFLSADGNGISCHFSFEKLDPWQYAVRDKNGTIFAQIDFNTQYDQISEVLVNLQQAKATRTELQTEVTAREEADTQLQADLATEATTARAAEKANADAIVAEKERAEGIEAKLRTDVDYCGQRIDEDLENTSKALEYKVQWDESKSKIVLPSGGQLVGTKYGADGSNPADGAVIAQLNEWDVMDFGSTKFALNLNVPSGVRPTVQEAGQSGAEANKIAYLSDIEELKTIIATLTQRIEALESK